MAATIALISSGVIHCISIADVLASTYRLVCKLACLHSWNFEWNRYVYTEIFNITNHNSITVSWIISSHSCLFFSGCEQRIGFCRARQRVLKPISLSTSWIRLWETTTLVIIIRSTRQGGRSSTVPHWASIWGCRQRAWSQVSRQR